MSRPDPRRQAAAMSAAFAGAVDLSALAARAQQSATAPAGPAGPAQAPSPPPPSGAGAEFVLDVGEAEFGQLIQQVSMQVPVVFELWSPRTAVGAEQSAALQRLAQAGGGAWLLARVDADQFPRIAQAFGVQSVPTVVAVAGGQPLASFAEPLDDVQLGQWIAQLLDALRERMPAIAAAEEAAGGPAPVPADPRFTAAEDLLDAGDFAGAAQAYQAILNAEPANAQAQAALTQVLFLQRVSGHDPSVLEAAATADPAAPDYVATITAAADLQVAAGAVEQAFDTLIAAVKATAGDERTALREHLVSLFALFPADDPAVRSARRALAAALF